MDLPSDPIKVLADICVSIYMVLNKHNNCYNKGDSTKEKVLKT